jgi:hypothetical protein
MKSQEKRLFDNNKGSHYPQQERRPSIRLKDHLTFSTIQTSNVKEPFNVSKTVHHRGWKGHGRRNGVYMQKQDIDTY